MTYSIKSIFYTLQGEGAQTGRPSVFLRFAGCNLWSGLEQDRAAAVCQFCDTDFVGTDGEGGGKFQTADSLVDRVRTTWEKNPQSDALPWVVCTGGEPLLQLDAPLIDALHGGGFEIAIESNGTIAAPTGIDWICISPKADAPLIQTSGDEIKLVYPQEKALPERFGELNFQHFFLQPMDGPYREENTRKAAHYCHNHSQWRISLQTHKIIGID